MRHRCVPLLVATLGAATVLAACDGPDAPPPAAPPVAAGTATPEAPSPLPVDGASGDPDHAPYRCDEGSLVEARFGHYDATVRLPDGTTRTLPRAESASAGGSDVYVGGDASIERDGDRLQLSRGGGDPVTCLRDGGTD